MTSFHQSPVKFNAVTVQPIISCSFLTLPELQVGQVKSAATLRIQVMPSQCAVCVVCSVQCAVFSVQCTVCSVQCAP